MNIKRLIEALTIALHESPRLTKAETNVPVLLWASKRMSSHSSRVKIFNRKNYRNEWNPETSNDILSVTICDNPQIVAPDNYDLKIKKKDFQKLCEWIKIIKSL